MSEDPAAGDDVPDAVREWLAGLADEQGLSEQELLGRLLAGDGRGADGAVGVDGEALAARVDELEVAVSNLEADLDEKIRDVRERVIQVKRETDEKAPVEHDHPALAEGLDRLEGQVESLGRDFVDLDAAVDRTDDRVAAVDDRLEAGFENYEEVLDYLVDATDDVEGKLTRLLRATLDLEDRLGRVSRAEARRGAADELREAANRGGVSTATCDGCGETVDLSLLAAPACPHCASKFTELEPRRGFFRSSLLHTGERPALEGDVEGESPDLESLVADDGPTPPSDLAGGAGDRERAGEGADDPAGPAEPGQSAEADPAGGPVRTVSGVGDEYAARLRDADVETVGDLARADPADLAEATGIPTGRLETLVSRARERLDPA